MKEKPNLLIVCGVNALGKISMPEPIDVTPYSDYHIVMCIIDNFAAYLENDLEALFPGITRFRLTGLHDDTLKFINACVNNLRILNHNGLLASIYIYHSVRCLISGLLSSLSIKPIISCCLKVTVY